MLNPTRALPRFAAAVAGAIVIAVAISGVWFAMPAFAQQPVALADAAPAVLRNYQPVTTERLSRPEDGNWLMIRRTYDGWGYSPLTEITPANVARLRLVWTVPTGEE